MIVPFASYIDRFVIGAILGAASVTSYAIPSQLASRLSVLPNALTTALFPRLSGVSAEERLMMSERATLTMAGLLTAPFIGVIFIIGPFVAIWAGKHLGPEAGMIGRITVPAMWANALGMVSYTRLQSSGRPDLVTKILLLEVPFYLLLLYFGTQHFGLLGAALAMAFRYIADAVMMTAMAGPPTRRWQIIAAHAALLVVAVWWASVWPITDWRWWAGAAGLCGLAAGLALRTVPKDIIDNLVGRARTLVLRSP
jgi:O-antigen/teichoic acid export membrane protein